MIKILDSNLKRVAILPNVENPSRMEEINGQNTFNFASILNEKVALYINENNIVEIDNDYFDIIYYQKQQAKDGKLTIDVQTEHVSYRLNKPVYNKEYFTATGTPTQVLTQVLEGTEFTVGTVEFTENITYSAQEAKSRRQILMEVIALLGGELDFNKFEISIVKHRGNTTPKLLTKGKNIKVVSKVFDGRQLDINGNPTVSYTCSPIQLGEIFNLGDEALLIQKDLGIQQQLRIVKLTYNPYNNLDMDIEISNITETLEMQMYKVETNTIMKDKLYYGTKISSENGIEVVRSDNLARSIFNADKITFQIGDGQGNWIDAIYFDTVTKKYKFVGDIVMESGSISWGDVQKPSYSASDVGALSENSPELTYIDQNGIYTGSLTANQITAGVISANRIATNISQVNTYLDLGSGEENGQITFKNNAVIRATDDGVLGIGLKLSSHTIIFEADKVDFSSVSTVSGLNAVAKFA